LIPRSPAQDRNAEKRQDRNAEKRKKVRAGSISMPSAPRCPATPRFVHLIVEASMLCCVAARVIRQERKPDEYARRGFSHAWKRSPSIHPIAAAALLAGSVRTVVLRLLPGMKNSGAPDLRSGVAVQMAVSPRLPHYPQLDGLRGVAVLLVIAGHILMFSHHFANEFGSLGVMLFFVLSGFLITSLLINERDHSGDIDVRAFYQRRLLRLGPALAVFLTAVALLAFARLIVDVRPYELFCCVFYVRNIFGRSDSLGHLWSLSLEEQFYLFWPWLMRWIGPRRMLRMALLAIVVISVARMVAIAAGWFDYNLGITYVRPWFRFDSILIGCCIALGRAGDGAVMEGIDGIVRRTPPLVLWTGLFGWTIWGNQMSHVWFLTIQMLAAALVVLQLLSAPASSVRVLLCNRMLRHIGRVSYGLYLWQQLFTANPAARWGALQVFPVNVAASFTIAEISYHFVERPFLLLKERLRPRLDGNRLAAASLS